MDNLVAPQYRFCFGEMFRQFSSMFLGLFTVKLLQCLGNPGMEPDRAVGRQL